MAIPKDLREILACAFCKEPVDVKEEKITCSNAKCGLIYRIQDDIPVMLIDEAERSCPSCKQQRTWEDDILRCPGCGETLKYERS